MVVTWWYWVNIGWYGSVLGDNGSKSAALVASVICFQKIFGLHGLNHQIIEYWVSRARYWLVLRGIGQNRAVLVAHMMNF